MQLNGETIGIIAAAVAAIIGVWELLRRTKNSFRDSVEQIVTRATRKLDRRLDAVEIGQRILFEKMTDHMDTENRLVEVIQEVLPTIRDNE